MVIMGLLWNPDNVIISSPAKRYSHMNQHPLRVDVAFLAFTGMFAPGCHASLHDSNFDIFYYNHVLAWYCLGSGHRNF